MTGELVAAFSALVVQQEAMSAIFLFHEAVRSETVTEQTVQELIRRMRMGQRPSFVCP